MSIGGHDRPRIVFRATTGAFPAWYPEVLSPLPLSRSDHAATLWRLHGVATAAMQRSRRVLPTEVPQDCVHHEMRASSYAWELETTTERRGQVPQGVKRARQRFGDQIDVAKPL